MRLEPECIGCLFNQVLKAFRLLKPDISNEIILKSTDEGINTIESLINNGDEVLPMEVYEKIIIEKALNKYGSFNSAGKALGLTHKTVAAKARKFGIEKKISWDKRTI